MSELKTFSKAEIECAFDIFAANACASTSKEHKERFPNLPDRHVTVAKGGRVYWKLIISEGGLNKSVYGFVRKSDGAILMSASWKSPNVKGNNYIRGFVTDDDFGASACTLYGVGYAHQ